MQPQEKAVVATVASSCLLAFLLPQMCFQGFLRSYYDCTGDGPRPSLDERLASATLPDNKLSSGIAFPYSAARMRSLVADDDGFTSSSFHGFLVRGLRPYLSCGALDFASNDANSGSSGGAACDEIAFRAGVDLLQLLAMAICLAPPVEEEASPAPSPTKAGEGAGRGGVLDGMRQIVRSTLPFSFQLSYSDRLQVVRACMDLCVPEGEERARAADDADASSDDGCENNVIFSEALRQLRAALSCFASLHARSDGDAGDAYAALTNVAVNGGERPVRAELERLLRALASASGRLAAVLGDCLASLVTRHNGSRYYADGEFVRFALGLLGRVIHERVWAHVRRADGEGAEEGDLASGAEVLLAETAKRRKTETPPKTERTSSAHFVALTSVARSLFYFLLDPSLTEGAKDKDASETEQTMAKAEVAARNLLLRDVSLLLCYPSDPSVVRSASQLLALAMSYDERFIADKGNVTHLFKFTRQALDDGHGSKDVVQHLRPLIITASRQSRTFAESLLSYAVQCTSSDKNMKWKIASLISSARPIVVSNRIAELAEKSSDSAEYCGDIACDEITTRLSCTLASYSCASSDNVERCLSLADGVANHWALFQLVRHAFSTGSFGFARHILGRQRLQRQCSQQKHFLWLTALSRIAEAEDVLGKRGAVGISDSLEQLNSCLSILQSLATLEQDSHETNDCETLYVGKFGFQLGFLAAKIDFLNLCMITRSLCSECIVTGGGISARSKQWATNLPKCFAKIISKCRNIYRLYGLHFCQQTRTSLRTLLDLCQFMQESVQSSFGPESEQKNKYQKEYQKVVQDCLPKGDRQCSMGSLLVRLRAMRDEKPSDAIVLWELLETLFRCPMPFPLGFFRIKSIPCSLVNVSSDTRLLPAKQNDDHTGADASRNYVEVTPGLPFKLILSGIVPEDFMQSADVEFSQIIAWKTTHYERCLYDDDDAKATHSGSSIVEAYPLSQCFSSPLQPRRQFILPISCPPFTQEGVYRMNIKLGCRDVRCTEWLIPTMTPLEISLRVEDY